MISWGISARSHDAALAVFADGALVFAAHAERYSKIKNDCELAPGLIADALAYGEPGQIVWYERPWLKKTRQVLAGQWQEIRETENIARYLSRYLQVSRPVSFVSHHLSHAAAGYYTSPFRDATIIVLDAIGEWQTFTIWEAAGTQLKLRFSQRYPHSVGLWYSAMTQRCGFKPNEEEYILMGLSAFGDPLKYYDRIKADFFVWRQDHPSVRLRHNLHRGCRWWAPDITDVENIAAATQRIYDDILLHASRFAGQALPSRNLVLMGGCALNCVANRRLADSGDWDDIWVMPCPGDAGSSIGCVLATMKEFVHWPGPFLGHCIDGSYPVAQALRRLTAGEVVGIANGRAEFGPRALGNRSLLADPRIADSQSKVNAIKQREKFRPFAPAIMAEMAADYFDMGLPSSPYMQFTARCKQPEQFPGIVHVDGTSRVQTVTAADNPGFYALLREFHDATGCPMLLNTSLNVKGEPLVNDRQDAARFAITYGVPVFCDGTEEKPGPPVTASRSDPALLFSFNR
ncbi:carbamoyltransferase family protein [Collimonas fungivorans]|uniref:Carbamoyltransferase family protein n=1 Tax=Collimonas fungivorans TaxID=158899 RepID=A0A127PFZ2_9BURK|nr:carbamoyltransferase C-terminal domain-containing protein [Collimonas fungivorans]AMO96722.1 carbamoyltransferase family protein [Collimonas fungivorans]